MVVISRASMGVVVHPLRVAKPFLPPPLPAITILETAIFYWGVRDLPTNKMILKLF